MQDNEKKPALRFKGFTDPWEQRKLGEICDFITKGATPTTYGFSWQPDGVPFFRNDSIKDNVFVFGEFSYISEAANEVLKRSEVHGNDILIAITGDIGKVGIIPDTVEKANINQHIARVRIRKEALPYFVYQYLASDDTQKEYQKIKTGLSMPQLSLEQVRDIVVKIPEFNEQGKIADCLRRIDTLITLHQRKYEKLVNIKKSMLDKMFPKNGASVPEIRFKGFTDLWEQRKISELAEKTYGGGTPTTSNEAFWNGNIPWIQSSDIVDGKLMGVEPRKYITQTGLNSSATQLVPKNSIAIITRVGVGKLAYMPFSYSTSQDFLSLSKLNTEPFFTVYACYKKLQSELNTVQGTSIKGITKDELLAKTISVPVYSEQKQIGSFFAQLDTLITLHQCKLEKLQNIKKSCLEKMFA